MTADFVGYFGKLPGSGDFVSRGLERSLILKLDVWLQEGLASLASMHGPAWLNSYLVAPAWHFVMPAGLWSSSALMGSTIPSVDRVGRYFPLIALRSLPKSEPIADLLATSSTWLDETRTLLIRALQECLSPDSLYELLSEIPIANGLERYRSSENDIFSVLGQMPFPAETDSTQATIAHSWPDLAKQFDVASDQSFWWSHPTASQAGRRLTHRQLPNLILFEQLFGPPANPDDHSISTIRAHGAS